MTQLTLFSRKNVRIADAPPSYFEPDANGIAVPTGFGFYRLTIDQTNVPANSSYGFFVEFLAGGVWEEDAGSSDFSGGLITLHTGVTTFINFVASSIGRPTSPYPTAGRIRVDSWDNAWRIPSIELVLSDVAF